MSAGIQVDCQERGLREEDWNDPIDSREEGSQKFASKAANAAAAAAVALKVPVLITSAEVNAVIAAPLPSAAKKGSNAKVNEHSLVVLHYFY
jgi:hypothetical protein